MSKYRDQFFEIQDIRDKKGDLKHQKLIVYYHLMVTTVIEKYHVKRCNDTFYIFDQTHYIPKDKEFFLQEFKEMLKNEDGSIYEGIRSRHYTEALNQLLAEKNVCISEEFFEIKNMINFKNGVLDINDLLKEEGKIPCSIETIEDCDLNVFKNIELKKHSPKYGFKSVIDHNYQNTGKKPEKFLHFLNQISLKDEKFKKCLCEFAGYILSGESPVLEKFLIFYGSGANGKSTFFNIISEIVGFENILKIGFLDLVTKEANKIKLNGKLLYYSSETKKDELIRNTEFLKELTSGESICGRDLYKSLVQFKPFCKVILSFNELPKVIDASDGFSRRLILLNFKYKVPSESKDYYLIDKLKEERSEIINLFFFNYLCLKKRSLLKNREDIDYTETPFTIPDCHKEILNEVRFGSDSFEAFIKDYDFFDAKKIDQEEAEELINKSKVLMNGQDMKLCGRLRNGDYFISISALFYEYADFCKENGYQKPSAIAGFKQKLKAKHPYSLLYKDEKGRIKKVRSGTRNHEVLLDILCKQRECEESEESKDENFFKGNVACIK